MNEMRVIPNRISALLNSLLWDRIFETTTKNVSIWEILAQRTALSVSLDDSSPDLVIAPRPHEWVALRVGKQALHVAQRHLVVDRSGREVADVPGRFGPVSVDDVPERHELEDVGDTADELGDVSGNTERLEFGDGGEEDGESGGGRLELGERKVGGFGESIQERFTLLVA